MLIIRRVPDLSLRSIAISTCSNHNFRTYTKDYSSSDDEKKINQKKRARVEETPASVDIAEPAATRLNRLLASMQTDDNCMGEKQESMARPGESAKKRRETAKQQATTKNIFEAVKHVSSLLGDTDKKQTESELLAKLLGHNQNDSSALKQDKNKPKVDETELSLSELIVGMKIDRTQTPKEQNRSEFVRHMLAGKRKPQQVRPQASQWNAYKREPETFTGSVNIHGGEPIGIFKDPAQLRESPDMLSTWAHLYTHELQLQVAHPPANYFEKIARWTEQGKVWRFPIDNEQDMHEEAEVDFSEHIFLEQHLEAWCPSKGPIRHFMELVCVGLAKNHYISAQDKKEHILWFRDYFESKKDLLKEYISKEKMGKTVEKESHLSA